MGIWPSCGRYGRTRSGDGRSRAIGVGVGAGIGLLIALLSVAAVYGQLTG